jgi:hypothetical protein
MNIVMEEEEDVQPEVAPDVQLNSIQDSVVSDPTRSCYICEIICIVFWLYHNHSDVLTAIANTFMCDGVGQSPEMLQKGLYKKYKNEFQGLLRSAHVAPLFVEVKFSADMYMDYLRQQRICSCAYLSKSASGLKSVVLFHFFRLQNRTGYPDTFKMSLNNLLRGFFEYWLIGRLQWFLLMRETNDSVFAHSFLLTTLNLGCRVNNTTIIRLHDMSWSSSFDCYHIVFEHSKTDQTG